MINNLKIKNMVVTGKLPFKNKLTLREMNKLIMKGELGWMENSENHPMLSAEIRKQNHKKRRKVYFSIWPAGAINILGVIRKEEAREVYEMVLNEIKRICPRVLQDVYK